MRKWAPRHAIITKFLAISIDKSGTSQLSGAVNCGFLIRHNLPRGIETQQLGVELVKGHRVEELVAYLLNYYETYGGHYLQLCTASAHKSNSMVHGELSILLL